MLFPASLLFVGYLVQDSTEEIVFRGWLLPTLGVSPKPWIAILISSLLFALLYGANDNITLFAIVNLILFGVLFHFLRYEKEAFGEFVLGMQYGIGFKVILRIRSKR